MFELRNEATGPGSNGISLVLALLAVPFGTTLAQTGWTLGGGSLAPFGDYSHTDRNGWDALVGLTLDDASHSFAFRPGVFLAGSPGSIAFDGRRGASRQLVGLGLDLVLHSRNDPTLMPYALVGVGGYLYADPASNGTSVTRINYALDGGLGISLRTARIRIFGEFRYVANPAGHGLSLLPLTVGMSFGGG